MKNLTMPLIVVGQVSGNGLMFSEAALKQMCASKPYLHFDEDSKSMRIDLDEVEFAPEMIGDQLVGISMVGKSAVQGG